MTPATVRPFKVVIGFGLLSAGIVMLAVPGAGWLTIAAGLAMLADEFPWARRCDRAEMHAMDMMLSVVESPHRTRRHAKATRRLTGDARTFTLLGAIAHFARSLVDITPVIAPADAAQSRRS